VRGARPYFVITISIIAVRTAPRMLDIQRNTKVRHTVLGKTYGRPRLIYRFMVAVGFFLITAFIIFVAAFFYNKDQEKRDKEFSEMIKLIRQITLYNKKTNYFSVGDINRQIKEY
jgi:hypothetical protein